MKQKVVVLSLAFALFLALSGCNGRSGSSSTASSTPSASSTSPSSVTSSALPSSTPGSSAIPSSSLDPYAAHILTPTNGGELALNDSIVQNYWGLSVDPFATQAAPDESLSLLLGAGVQGHDRPSASVLFDAPKGGEYRVRVSLKADFSDSFERKAVAGDEHFSAKLLTLYPETTYYAEVISSQGEVLSAPISFVSGKGPRLIDPSGEEPRNIRDMGGYAGETGKRIRYGMIYRGNKIDELEPSARMVLGQDLGINSEIDFRAAGGDTGYQSVNMIDLKHPYYSVPLTGYENNLGQAQWEAGIKSLFEIAKEKTNYPLYIHCTYGADRTGTAAFLLNGLCGVSFADLTRDFELTSFGLAQQLRTMDTSYGSWIRLYNAMMAKGKTGDTLAECIHTYLLSIGVEEETMTAVKSLLLEDVGNPIPNSEYHASASLKAPYHTSVIGGSADKAWAEEGDDVTLSVDPLLSGSTFTGWKYKNQQVSTASPYTFKIAETGEYQAITDESEEVKNGEKDDLFYSASLQSLSTSLTSYRAVDTPLSGDVSRRAFAFSAKKVTATWPNVMIKLATPISVTSGVFSFDKKLVSGNKDWLSFTCFDASLTALGSETGHDGKNDGAWETVSFAAPAKCTVYYLRFSFDTADITNDEDLLVVLDNLHFTVTEGINETGTPGASGYSATNLENLPLDSGMSSSATSFDRDMKYDQTGAYSLKSVVTPNARSATWMGDVTLNPAIGVGNRLLADLPDFRKGTFGGYFHFSSDYATPKVLIAVAWDSVWAQTSNLEMDVGEADANGWRHASIDTAKIAALYTGGSTSWNGKVVRIVLSFSDDFAQGGTVYLDQLSFSIA